MNAETKTVTIDEALEIAIGHQLEGRPAQAISVYRKILAGAPDNTKALHLLGVALHQTGDSAGGIQAMEQAISLNPLVPEIHNNCAEAYRLLGKIDSALMRYDTAIKLRPEYAEAWNNRGVALSESERGEEAEKSFARAIEINPDYAEAHHNYGWLLLNAGRPADAVREFEAAIRLRPDYPEAVVGFEQALQQAGGSEAALKNYETELRKLLDGVAASPDNIPSLAQAYCVLGNSLKVSGKLEEARQSLAKAVRLDAANAQAHNDLGVVLQHMGLFEDATHAFRNGRRLEPGSAVPHSNLGAVLKELGRYDEARTCLARAIEIDPGFDNAHYNLALLFLAQGRFAEAWPHYAHRPTVRGGGRPVAPPARLPADLSGKCVFVKRDQGLGDEVFFLRYLPLLKARGAHIAYRCGEKLAGLLKHLPLIDEVVSGGAADPAADFVVQVGDLPLALSPLASSVVPSLRIEANPEKLAAVRDRLAQCGAGPYIGVTWQAGQTEAPDYSRSWQPPRKDVAPSEVGRALAAAPGQIIVLQRDADALDASALSYALNRPCFDFGDLNDDLESMLALLSVLDEYVAVSNTNVHLRALTGRPSRVLIPLKTHDWRWTVMGDHAPWFPDCIVYRESSEAGWSEVMIRLGHELADQGARAPAQRYTRENPSPRYQELTRQYQTMHEEGEKFLGIPAEQTFPGISLLPQAKRIKALVAATGTRSLLDYGSGKGRQYQIHDVQVPGESGTFPSVQTYWGVESIRCYDPAYTPHSMPPEGTFDGVISTDVLEHCPEEDVPWIVGELFAHARRFVFANVASYPARKRLPTGENAHCTIQPAAWWTSVFREAARQHPGIRWQCWIQSKLGNGKVMEEMVED